MRSVPGCFPFLELPFGNPFSSCRHHNMSCVQLTLLKLASWLEPSLIALPTMEADKSHATIQHESDEATLHKQLSARRLPAFLPGKHLVASGWLGPVQATHRPVWAHSDSCPAFSTARVGLPCCPFSLCRTALDSLS